MEKKITRRDMLGTLAAASIMAAALPTAKAFAQGSAAAKTPMNLGDWDKPIDIHGHVEPESATFTDFNAEEYIAKDFASRIRTMDRYGIERAVLSPGFRYRKAEGIVNTRKMNDMIATYVAKHPDRFPVGLGTRELAHGDASLQELERLAKDLKFRGVIWHHAYMGLPIDHPFMRPLLRRIQELKLIPFIHARQQDNESWWRLEILAQEFPALTFVALASMTNSDSRLQSMQILKRRPNIMVDTGPLFYGGEYSITAYVKQIGADRLLFGTDGQPTMTLQVVRNAPISQQEKELILSGNTKKLLGL